MSKKIIFFGTEDFSLGALEALVTAGYVVAAVVTKPDSPQGRGQKLTPPKVKVFADAHDIPVWQPLKLSEIADNIKAIDSPVGILVSFGKIIPQSIIDLFEPGIINVHPSQLPKYRGPSPIESTILNGDTETAVSIMQLSAAMDAGPIYGYTSRELRGDETAPELYRILGELGNQTLLELLPLILQGTATGLEQSDQEATYCHLIQKSDGVIDWNKPASQIEREIRAYAEWPKSRTTLGAVDVIITKAQVVTGNTTTPGTITIENDELFVSTAQNLLKIIELKPAGKKEMPVKAFLSGYRSQLVD